MKKKLSFRISAAAVALLLCVSTVACTTDQVLSDIETAISIAGALAPALSAVAPADAAAVQLISGSAVAGLKDMQADYDAWTKSGSTSDLQKCLAVANQIKANLPSQLAALHITDPKAQQAANAWVNLITSSIDAVVAAYPQTTANPAELRTRAAASSIPTPEQLKARWASEVCGGNAHCAGLVSVKHAHKHGKFVRSLTFGKLQ